MPDKVTNYKCPACTGPLRFDGATGRLVCDYCGNTASVEEIEALYAAGEQQAANAFEAAQQQPDEWDASGLGGEWGSDAANMRAYTCPSCGAELICDATTAATSCPYCGNPTVVPGQFSGTLRPDLVIPFRLDRNAAISALKNHYNKKVFLPSAFRQENHIQEIKGLYVPFWLFDGMADADASFHTTRVHVRRSGNEEITTTEHFNVRRSGTMEFQKVPVDGSSKMPDAHMDSIEPYDYTQLKPFSTAYLPGFMADKYDVSREESAKRADARCENTAVDMLTRSVTGYASCTMKSKSVRLHRGKVHYALLPVWVLSTQWNGNNYLFTMNGQTGKLIGDLPVDKKKFWGMFAGLTAGITAAAFAVIQLLGL